MAGWKHEKHLQLPGYPPIQRSYSALINARGLGVLVRLRDLTGDASLNEPITGLLNSFEHGSDDGGIRKTDGDNVFYLEYSYGEDSPVVYNGFYSALIGLYDCYKHAPRKEQREQAQQLFDDGFQTMLRTLDDAELHGYGLDWLRYDDTKLFFADGDYINIEINQLKTLYEYTDNEALRDRLEAWQDIRDENAWKASLFEWPYFLYKRLLPKQHG
jgi:hypothetical protein